MDVKSLDPSDLGDSEEVSCSEDPGYESAFSSNRERALAAVASFAVGSELAQAASLLYQVRSRTTVVVLLSARTQTCNQGMWAYNERIELSYPCMHTSQGKPGQMASLVFIREEDGMFLAAGPPSRSSVPCWELSENRWVAAGGSSAL